MPTGVFVRREDYKKQISETLKRKYREGYKSPLIGKKLSKEHKRKIARIGSQNGMWKGGKFISHSGYVRILKPEHPFSDKEGYITEHRLIMEKIIGRYLHPKEIVHHINGIKHDNRPENLQWLPSLSCHMRLHCLIRKLNK